MQLEKTAKKVLQLISGCGKILVYPQGRDVDHPEGRTLTSNTTITIMTKTKDTAELIRAAYNGHYGYCKRLIEKGANVNGKDRGGWSALHYTAVHAEKSRETEIIELLLDNGANIDILTKELETPLHMACREWHPYAAKYLVERGANVNAKDIEGYTALHSAASFGYTDICKMLLEHGADVNAKTNDGKTALSEVEEGHIELRELLLSYGATA